MTFAELKEYVTEAIGEEVITVDKLIAGVRAGFGDMIHRGYRQFEHLFTIQKDKATSTDYPFEYYNPGLCTMAFPSDALELLYVKIFFGDKSYQAAKVSLNNPAIQCLVKHDLFRTDFAQLDYENPPKVIYYKKGDMIFIEWDYEHMTVVNEVTTIEVGYYKNLPVISKKKLREYAKIADDKALDISNLEIPIADDYANVLVNFMIWYVALSQDWEQERLTVLKNEYKYSMEDLLARKNKEDMYDETTNIQKIDGVM